MRSGTWRARIRASAPDAVVPHVFFDEPTSRRDGTFRGSAGSAIPNPPSRTRRNSVANIPDASPAWRKSTFSFGSGECVEVAHLDPHTIGLRDSKDPGGPVLTFTRGEFRAFADGVSAGEFDDLC
jgi:hypothetical protein